MRAARHTIAVFLSLALRVPALGDGAANMLNVHFVDVGQGDAIWIQGPVTGTASPRLNIIIDGGPDRGENNRLITYLEKFGLARGSVIDCVIATHPHEDHYPGLLDVFERYDVRMVIDSGFPKEGPKFAAFAAAARKEVAARRGGFVEMRKVKDLKLDWGELEARILHADSADLANMGSSSTRENNASTVVRLAFGKFSFLFMGDAEGKEREDDPATPRFVEALLLSKLRAAGDLHANVLKVAHHGSETSSTLPFIRAVAPDVVVIMSGRRAFRGTFLPDRSVIDRYVKARPGIVVLRTDDNDEAEQHDTMTDADGDDVRITTDGDSMRVYKTAGPVRRRRWVLVRKFS
jgi:beta-lactamase superfamily II metal-dependent hydrolase